MLSVSPLRWAARCGAVMLAGAAAGGLLDACAGSPSVPSSSTANAPSPATVVSIAVSGAAPLIGATAQFSATATLSDGTTKSVTNAAGWSSSDGGVAAVSAGGVVTGVAAGDADITATYQSVSGKAVVTIARAAPHTFTISGTLRDGSSGGVLPRIPVQAADSTGATRSAATDASGAFAISGVAPGPATLTVAIASYETLTQTTNVSGDTRVDLVLTRMAPPPPQFNLTGTWTGTGSDGLGPETFTWVLTQSGGAISGSASMRPVSLTDGTCASCHKVKDGSLSGSIAGTSVTLRMSFALGGSQPTPTCLVIMDIATSAVTGGSLSASYNGSDSCEPAVALGSISMTRQ